MTLFSNNPILFILGVAIFLFFVSISIKFPIIPAAIYPFTFLIFTQTKFSVDGISPSKYLGVVLIFVGMIYLVQEVLLRAEGNYLLIGLFCLMMLFPVWILIRFLLEGSDINLALTFMLNALTAFSMVVIVNTQRRREIMEISLGATFVVLSFGMIAAHFFPSTAFLGSLQQGAYARAMGFVNDPNYGGAFVAIGFAFFFSKAVFFYEARKMGLFYLSLLLIAISVCALLMTISRAAILSGVVCLFMAAFYGRIKLRNLSWFGPALAILFVLYWIFPNLIDGIAYRLSIITMDGSNAMRLEFFRTGMGVIRDNPLWGIGNFSGYHNAFIDVAVFGGLIGLGFFVSLILVVFRMNTKIMATSEGGFRDMARFVILGLIVVLFNSLFIGMETERIVWYLFGWGMINFILYRKANRTRAAANVNRLPSRNRMQADRPVA